MSAISLKRLLLIPMPVAALCFVCYVVPWSFIPFRLRVWTSIVSSPVLIAFLNTNFVIELGLPYATVQIIQAVILGYLFAAWFSTVFIPFWIDYRLGRLSLAMTRVMFLAGAFVLTAAAWYHVFYGVP